jgi:hypothetical protein
MRLINIIRRFTIAGIILLIVVLIEVAYYGLHPKSNYYINDTAYSVAAPFFNNFSDISSPINIMFLFIIFVISYMVVSNIISKKKTTKRYK